MITTQELNNIVGEHVVDTDGDKVGKVGQIFVDDNTGEPKWFTVNTGLFGMKETFVPLQLASVSADGTVRVDSTKDFIKDAPNVGAEEHLDPDEERRLYDHYGLGTDYTSAGTAGRGRTDAAGRADTRDTDTRGTATRGDADRGTDRDAMTRSEEHLRVGTEGREAGRARLRKYVVNETETVNVPVQREEVRVEREPITDANRDEALSGPDITEDEHVVTLHEEVPVVDKVAKPVERVRLEKDTVTDTETVSGEVREERIDVEGETDTDRRR